MIIAVLAGELKETEVRNSHSLQLNSEVFAVVFYFVCLIGEGTGMWLRARSEDLAML